MSKGRTAASIEERVVRMHDYQHALAALSRAASESLGPERLMHYVTAQVSRVTHIKRVKVLQYRPDRGDLLVVAGVGWKPGVVGAVTLGIDSASPPGRAVQTAAPVIIEDLPNDPEFRLSGRFRVEPCCLSAFTPVAWQRRPPRPSSCRASRRARR